MIHTNAPPATPARWRIAQACGLTGLVVLMSGLVLLPDLTMTVLWFGLIPALPIVLLIAPRSWRNICPLATLETLASRSGRPRMPSPSWHRHAPTVGILLFGALVPARAILFDSSAPSVLGVALLASLIAVATGLLFRWKAGFCNAFCPMLPVERLYGQAPLLEVANGRCGACTQCTPAGCFDLTPRKSIAQLLGRARKNDDWLRTPFGLFATSFPGVILGYWIVSVSASIGTQQQGWVRIAGAYGAVALCAFGATWMFRSLARARRWTWTTVMRGSAALSASMFYGLGANAWASAWHLGLPAEWSIRLGGWLVVGVWVVRSRPARPG